MAEAEGNVKLTSSDGKDFAVPGTVAKMSVSMEKATPPFLAHRHPHSPRQPHLGEDHGENSHSTRLLTVDPTGSGPHRPPARQDRRRRSRAYQAPRSSAASSPPTVVTSGPHRTQITLKNILDDLGVDDEHPIPLPTVPGAILKMAIDYCTHHKDDPVVQDDVRQNQDSTLEPVVGWDADFVKVDQPTLFEMILAANFLDIKPMLDLTCKTVAEMIRGKTPEEIRKHFNIKNDLASVVSPHPIMSSFDDMFDDLVARGRATAADLDRATDAIASGTKTEESLMSEWAPLALEDGAAVTLMGLKSRPELNGCEAIVVEFKPSSHRFALELTGTGETIAVKRENIAEAAAGAEVLSTTILGPDLARNVGSFLTCTRCLGPCTTGSKCRVKHPAHLRQEMGAMSGPEGMRSHYGCTGCGQKYDVLRPWSRNPSGGMEMAEPRIEGARWCYAGVCTTAPLPPADKRRILRGFAALKTGPRLQEEIDALLSDTKTLTITSGTGFYDDDGAVVLEHRLPELTELQLVDVCFNKIVLNEALTPSLQHLRMQNVPNECDLTIEAPRLTSVSIHFLGDCDDVINSMLAHATELESFDSYKLWVSELHFASNDLVSVDLHRSDGLDTLTLYAPNLTSLDLQACYGLETLAFQTRHPTLSPLLPPGHTPPPLEVNTANANLGRAARKALREHPSAVAGRTRHQGMPTEAMFAGMNGMMGGMMGGGDPWGEDDDYDDYDEYDEHVEDIDGMPPGFAEAMMAMGGGGMPPGMEGMSPEGLRMMMAMQGLGGMGDADADHDDVYDEDGEADGDGWVTVDDDDDDGEEGVVESVEGPPVGEDDGGNRIEEIGTPSSD